MAQLYHGLVGIYREAFPAYLRISSREMRKRLTRHVYRTHCLYDKEQLAGFALVVPTQVGTHLDYFAVDARYRGQGYAQKLLAMVMRQYPRLLLECEDHLINFYRRFGFVNTGLPYAYHGHKLNLMTRGLRKGDVTRLLTRIDQIDAWFLDPAIIPEVPGYLHYTWMHKCIPFSKHDAWGGKG